MRASRSACWPASSVLLISVARMPSSLHRVDLVLHQGDQRRDDQRHALAAYGRQLVAEALAAAGGHDAQAIVTLEDRRDDLRLTGSKGTEGESSEMLLQLLFQCVGHQEGSITRGSSPRIPRSVRIVGGRHRLSKPRCDHCAIDEEDA